MTGISTLRKKNRMLLKPSQMKHNRRVGKHRQRKATASRARMVRELDAIAREEVFIRDHGTCIAAGIAGIRCGDTVQWAHVLSRRHPCLRWEADNAMTLCAGHHLWWHHSPMYAVEWFVRDFPDRWRRLKAVHLANPKVNVRDLWAARCGGEEGNR